MILRLIMLLNMDIRKRSIELVLSILMDIILGSLTTKLKTDKMDMLDALVLRLINSSYVKVLYLII